MRVSRTFQWKGLKGLDLGCNHETHIADKVDGRFVLDSGLHALSNSLTYSMPYVPQCYKYCSLCQAPST